MRRALVAVAIVIVAAVALPATARPGDTACTVLCAPELKLEPTITIGNLGAARVEDVTTGEVRTPAPEPGFEIIFALGVPTQLARLGITLEGIVPVPGDHPELEAELNLMLVTSAITNGWLEAHLDIVDQLSPGKRPGTEGAYTHKLDLELDIAVFAFRWVREGNWLRHVEIEASLDYLVTGRPRRGDVVDGERYLDDASGWSASFLLVLPLAPLVPE